MNVYEMEGFLRGKCLPGDLKVNESIAEYLVRKLNAVSEFKGELTAALATIEKCREVVGCPAGVDLQDWVKQLAAENLTIIRLLTDISENHVEYFSEGEDGMFAGVPLDYVSEINMYVSRDVNAENPFPATDRIVAGIKADGVEEFAKFMLRDACGDKESQREIGEVLDASETFASQRRRDKEQKPTKRGGF